jgi:hypothetical protein
MTTAPGVEDAFAELVLTARRSTLPIALMKRCVRPRKETGSRTHSRGRVRPRRRSTPFYLESDGEVLDPAAAS